MFSYKKKININKTHKHTNYSYRHSKINTNENLCKLYGVGCCSLFKT